MYTFLSIFHIVPAVHLKALAKGLFSFLLVASFLASCITEEPASIVEGTVAPTLTCPGGLVVLALDGAESLTLRDDFIDVTAESESDDAPIITYDPAAVTTATTSVTVTATDAVDDTAISTCSFDVRVSENPIMITDCPDNINNGVVDIERRWTTPTVVNGPDGASLFVSVASRNAAASTATVTETGGTFTEAGLYRITFTAIAADGMTRIIGSEGHLFCNFEVTVTETAQALAITCSLGNNITVTIPSGETSVTLAEAGIAATYTGGTGDITLSYSKESLSISDNMTSITATATDETVPPVTATCDFPIIVVEEAMSKPGNSVFFLESSTTPPSADNPFLIQDAADLEMLARVVNANSNYTIGDMTEIPYRTADYLLSEDIILEASTGNGTSNFTPIGQGALSGSVTTCAETCFQGTFDGNSKTISGMQYNGDTTNLGLFGVIIGTSQTDEATISNLTLISPVITNNAPNTGALVGVALANSVISNVTVSGEGTTGMITGDGATKGGLVGENAGTIEASSSTIIVTSTAASVGGLVGENISSGIISASFATGTVTGDQNVGGLVGDNNSSATVTASAATGAVSATSTTSGVAGGLIGLNNDGMISASYASGTVTGVNSIGGLVGQQLGSAATTNSYATGDVMGTDASQSNIGGLVGLNSGTATIVNSYARGEVSMGLNLGVLVGGNENPTMDPAGGITASYGLSGTVTMGCNVVTPSSGTPGVCPADSMIVQDATILQAEKIDMGIYTDWDENTVWNFAANAYPALQAGGENQLPMVFTLECQRAGNCPTIQ